MFDSFFNNGVSVTEKVLLLLLLQYHGWCLLRNKYQLLRFMNHSVACSLFRRGRCKTGSSNTIAIIAPMYPPYLEQLRNKNQSWRYFVPFNNQFNVHFPNPGRLSMTHAVKVDVIDGYQSVGKCTLNWKLKNIIQFTISR